MNSLSNQGIKTLNELIVYTENDLKSFPNMGRTTIDEIKNLLKLFSLFGYGFRPINFEENKMLRFNQKRKNGTKFQKY